MLNEGIIRPDIRQLMKTEMIRELHKLGGGTPSRWQEAVFKRCTGEDFSELDWDFEDNKAGAFLWTKSFDQLIQELVEPEIWEEGENSIISLGGNLIVTAPYEVQEEVQDLLADLRATKSLAVTIEGRFLDLRDQFVEEIGFSWPAGFRRESPLWDIDPELARQQLRSQNDIYWEISPRSPPPRGCRRRRRTSAPTAGCPVSQCWTAP